MRVLLVEDDPLLGDGQERIVFDQRSEEHTSELQAQR